MPAGFDEWFEKATQRNPDARFGSAHEFADALAAVLTPGQRWMESVPEATPSGSAAPNAIVVVTPSSLGSVIGNEATVQQPARRARPSPRLAVAAIGMIALGAAGWLAGPRLLGKARTSDAVPARPTTVLTEPTSTLGCVVFEAKGVAPPAGWLGGAASALACRRMQWVLGGDATRVIPAPMLLGFPSDISASMPDDPYAPPELREKSRVAAMAKASAILDGSVEASEAGFRVELRLLGKTGQEVARGEGTGAEVDVAVDAAGKALDATKAFPAVARTTPDVQRAMDISDPRTGWAVDRDTFLRGKDNCRELLSSDLSPVWRKVADAVCAETVGLAPVSPPEVDHRSPTALALSVITWIVAGADLSRQTAALAQLEAAARTEANLEGRALLLSTAIQLADRQRAPHAFSLATMLVREQPWNASWQEGAMFADVAPTQDARAAMRLVARAWAPWTAESWATDRDAKTLEDSTRWLRRAHELHPSDLSAATTLGFRLHGFDRFTEVRALASRLLSQGEDGRTTALVLIAFADAAEGFPARALKSVTSYFASSPLRAGDTVADGYTIELALALGRFFGREREIMDDWATRRVLARPRVAPPPRTEAQILRGCLATSPAIATKCIEDLAPYIQPDDPVNAPFLEGSRRAAKGDARGAVRAWRPLMNHDGFFFAFLPLAVLERAGEVEIVRRYDERAVRERRSRTVRGYSSADVRMARRAAQAGDKAKARDIARELLAAWSSLDAEVPWLDELKKMAAD